MLEGTLTEKALEGFLIVCSRLVDEFGNHRTAELSQIFKTEASAGRLALLQSLEYINDWVGGMEAYERDYPVTINPSNPAFPQLKVVGIENLSKVLFRVISSNAVVHGTQELIRSYVLRTGELPPVPVQRLPVLREKPLYHWCSYEKWESPYLTREALQILPEWGNDCKLRALIETKSVSNAAYVAFSGDRYDPGDSNLRFYKYFFEPLAQDHPELKG